MMKFKNYNKKFLLCNFDFKLIMFIKMDDN